MKNKRANTKKLKVSYIKRQYIQMLIVKKNGWRSIGMMLEGIAIMYLKKKDAKKISMVYIVNISVLKIIRIFTKKQVNQNSI